MRALRLGVAVCFLAIGCGDDDDAASTDDPQAQAAEALARAMHFSGGELRDGAMGIATEDRVELISESDQVVEPGGSGIMPLEVDNPIADENDGKAVLLQFGDVDQHVRVPTKNSVDGPGDLNLEFELDDDVCDGLCAGTIDVDVTLALELEDGAISKHLKTTIAVDCSERGSEDACESGESGGKGGKPRSGGAGADGGTDDGNGGSSAGGGDGSVPIDQGATAAVEGLLDSVDDVGGELCSCLPASEIDACTEANSAERSCDEGVLFAVAASNAELLTCARMYFQDQLDCVTAAACDATMLESCSAASDDFWTALESQCGAVPAALQTGIDACGQSGVDDPGMPGRPTSFPCSNGSTLTWDKICDGAQDCPDGLDEMVCVACPDGSGMFSPYDQCDGMNACADGSDEASCNYPCASGEMIEILKLCDGTRDCSDGSDESFCSGTGFTCTSGESVPIMALCDGTEDCSDGSDESTTLCGGM